VQVAAEPARIAWGRRQARVTGQVVGGGEAVQISSGRDEELLRPAALRSRARW
jgi:hypothetical protein